MTGVVCVQVEEEQARRARGPAPNPGLGPPLQWTECGDELAIRGAEATALDDNDPRRVQALYRKGDAQLGLGRVAEAKDTLTMAYRLDSTNKQVSNLLKRIIKAQVRQKRWNGHL